MTVEKPKPKQLLRPITAGADSAMNQSQFVAIICNSLKLAQTRLVLVLILFGWKTGAIRPITKCSNRNHVITFDNRLKAALTWYVIYKKSLTHLD